MYIPSILHLLTTSLYLISLCWTINALCAAWFMHNFWELLYIKWRKIHHCWYLIKSFLVHYWVQGGRKWKKCKGGKTRILGRNCVPVPKGPWETKDWHTPGSLNTQVQQEHEHYCHSFIQHPTWLLVPTLSANVTPYFYLPFSGKPTPCVSSEINKFLN